MERTRIDGVRVIDLPEYRDRLVRLQAEVLVHLADVDPSQHPVAASRGCGWRRQPSTAGPLPRREGQWGDPELDIPEMWWSQWATFGPT